MQGRLIAIGDIHGCHKEFEDLLDKLDLTKDDRLILLGDLINRGPTAARSSIWPANTPPPHSSAITSYATSTTAAPTTPRTSRNMTTPR